ncbi:MAG: hypothetical protein LBL23_04460 [Coriobacteriales bacterium]|jgi:Flp pilus assembly protein TadB|nr:hypothetical protein [Coriobacteriales bacterium]
MSERQDRLNAERYERGKELLHTQLTDAVAGIIDAPSARERAREALEAFKEQKNRELEEATKRFSLLQRVEFVVGALTLVQIAVFMLRGEPYIVPLIFSIVACLILYLIVAILDSKARSRKQEIHYQLVAANKVKMKPRTDGTGVVFEFK